MIEVQIPKDVMNYKATLIGPFTTRQVVCGCTTAAVEYAFFSILNVFGITNILGLDSMVGIGTILAMPIMVFIIPGPFGMPMEKYLKNVLLLSLIAPKTRPYQTENAFECLIPPKDTTKKSKPKTYSPGELRKHPDYIIYE